MGFRDSAFDQPGKLSKAQSASSIGIMVYLDQITSFWNFNGTIFKS
jgi:hypothetical protein